MAPKAAAKQAEIEAAITRAFEFLNKNKKDLLLALAECRDDTARYSFLGPEISYIQTTLQALVGASGITNSGVACAQGDAAQTATLGLHHSAAVGEAQATASTRRKHRDAFDLVLLAALVISEQLTYDVGLDLLFQVAQALDPAIERPSLTAKLNRWKKDGYVRWVKSSKMFLVPNGHALYKEKVRACARPGGGLDEVAAALNKVFGSAPSFDAVLTAR